MAGTGRRFRTMLLTLGLLLAAAGSTLGQAQDEYRAVSPEELALERLPATPFVFWAYAIVWIVLVLYVFSLWRRLGQVERDLAALAGQLEQRRP